ncbi:hypothetical protein NDU88_003606 [Pleurodeles waltl]|uniref:Uncharacterized protein n=1 Tax=Pleurodeles waltl TaxID=8319 RepID=A0AAV7T5N2_PLEWA|nr:hypothetical protein NDU88_003606 [Pleurodeles waltl]
MGRLRSATAAQLLASTNLPSLILDTPQLADMPALSLLDKLDKLLAAAEHTQVSMEAKFCSLAADFGFLQDDHCNFVDRVSNSERTHKGHPVGDSGSA